MTDRAALLAQLTEDRWLAHQLLFESRHPEESAEGHEQLVRDIYDPAPRRLIEGFRGLGKSTFLEEAALIRAGFREFRYMVVVGASYSRACERLASIKRECEINDALANCFGRMKGNIWQEGKIVLTNGACIQALGRDQSMLGMKYLDTRPDAALIDDVEDPDEVRTDTDRQQTWEWLLKTFLPSLAHPLHSWIRVLGTRRGVGSLPERLEKAGWRTTKIPLEYTDEAGERKSSWPAKFPLNAIDEIRHNYRGDMHTYMQEYMCQPYSAADRVFTREMMRVEPRVRRWEAVYAMIDPARTTNRGSATTGWAVWSWLQNRLIVWAAGAETLKPDEIIDLCFTIASEYSPVWIGVEEDGLNEFLMQPIRHEQSKRHITVPIKAVRAPRGKLDFIRFLQPFYAAGEVIHANQLPELESQLLSFPTGKIDAPNALAYAVPMRPAAPVYDGFTIEHIAADLYPSPARPLYLAANATRSLVTAVLCQIIDGQLRVYADWVAEGDPAETVARIHTEAAMEGDTSRAVERHGRRDWTEALKLPARQLEFARLPVKWVVPPQHSDRWTNVGLLQAIARIPASGNRGADPAAGRNDLRDRLARARSFVVSERATWTLRALSGGYTRAVVKGGRLSEEAEAGTYRVLMEGIESLCGMAARVDVQDDVDNAPNYGVDKRGRRYLSAMPAR